MEDNIKNEDPEIEKEEQQKTEIEEEEQEKTEIEEEEEEEQEWRGKKVKLKPFENPPDTVKFFKCCSGCGKIPHHCICGRCAQCIDFLHLCICSYPCILHGGEISFCRSMRRRCGLKEAILGLQKKRIEAVQECHSEAVLYFDQKINEVSEIPCKECNETYKNCTC